MSHWSQFGAFAVVKEKLECEAEVLPEDILGTHIFMRWKEKFFVKVGSESRITIAGFYYICFSRSDGTIDGEILSSLVSLSRSPLLFLMEICTYVHSQTGYYYDPLSSPFQRIRLESSLKTGGSIINSHNNSDISTPISNCSIVAPGGLHGYAFPTYSFH